MSTKVKITENYCSILKRLLQYYYDNSNQKDETHIHIRRGILFINEFPVDTIELTGSKLYNYKEIVNSGELNKIGSYANNEEIRKKETPTTQSDIADSVINNVCYVWKMSNEKNKKEIVENIQLMLKMYIKYLLIEKKEMSK